MTNFFKLSLLALLVILCFSGCKKELLLKTSSSSAGKTGVANSIPDSMVMTPQGLMLKTKVHQIENGYHLEIRGGRMLKIETATGTLKEDLGAITFNTPIQSPASGPSQGLANPAANGGYTRSITPTNSTGWATYSEWYAGATLPIGTLSSKWNLPATPPSHSQIIYIGNGISAVQYSTTNNPLVIQPILEWGNNGISGTSNSTWTVSSWCCWNGNAAYTYPVNVTTGHSSFQGVITLTSQQTDGSYNYTSAFNGISNTTLTVIEGTTNVAGGSIVAPNTFPNIPILSWAYETLQSYGMAAYTDYPAQNSVDMTSISLQTGAAGNFHYPSTIGWTAKTGTNAAYGEHTILISDNSSTGEVDLWFHNAAPVISYTTPDVYSTCGGAITPLTPTNSGGPATWTVSPALPGLTIDPHTGIISGSPSASPATNYIVTATNNGGTSTFTINITVTGGPTIGYPATPEVYNSGTAITPVYPTVSGPTISGYTISPNLTTNTNLQFNTRTGEISGTPSPSAPTQYTITATSGTCTATATINIAVASQFIVYNKNTGSGNPPSSYYGSISISFKYGSASGTQYGAGVVYEGTNGVFWLPPGNYFVVCNPGYYQFPSNCFFAFNGNNPAGPTAGPAPGATFPSVAISPTNTTYLQVTD